MSHAPAKHWLILRFTALPLIPLFFYFFQARAVFTGTRADFIAWLKSPAPSVAVPVFLACAFYHASLGMEEIIEDYVTTPARRSATLLFSKACFLLAALASAYALAMIWTGRV